MDEGGTSQLGLDNPPLKLGVHLSSLRPRLEELDGTEQQRESQQRRPTPPAQ
jgi:hypothetical protein